MRVSYLEIYRRFRPLVGWSAGGTPAPADCSETQAREFGAEICRAALEPEEFKMGNTKMFLK